MFTLVRFSCGCVGTKPIEGVSTIIQSCDGEGDVSFYQRDIDLKTFEPLDMKTTEDFRSDIEKLICDGYRMKSFKRILDIK